MAKRFPGHGSSGIGKQKKLRDGEVMKITQKGDKYTLTLTHDELLALVNGLAGRQLLVRDITSLISYGDKKKEKELTKLHKAMAGALPPDVWE
ncbi:hypothetical protein [Desulfallas thermosapovorans]|uniref:Uncharacterized protein n=1 Tax=Desulfallas thermosapovorans DSM 6562 TaxID=1121431 RepID=A0A5S4ZVU4_9FIRM|nr:hypothetical protein [Desulfallas thermosapovorans]TYO97042.1 hypothetical protein LX24_00855 [Desulfallas thermosapovorans DSM 6562]